LASLNNSVSAAAGIEHAMNKLTAKKIESTCPQKKEYKLHDGNGLFLRIRPSGAKSWLFSFSLPGDRRLIRMTLGSVANITLKEARNMLPSLHKLVADGIDPRNARAATQTENVEAVTMQDLFDAWIEFTKLTQQTTSTWIKRHQDRWRLHLKKNLSNVLARDVTRAHLAAALDNMARKGIKEETRKALTTLNLMLDYGLTRHSIENNPARMLKPKDFAASANRSRDRVLSLIELQKLWEALDRRIFIKRWNETKPAVNPVISTAIKILILTGARRTEVAAMRWIELNLGTGVWQLPSNRTKNKQSHTIYLSPIAIKLIDDLKILTGQSKFVFSNRSAHIHSDSLTSAISRLIKLPNDPKSMKKASFAPLAGMKSFSVHDIRRSAATAWGEYLKIQPHVIEHMLNHQPLNKLIATYQRATYAEEQKAAWLAWGEMVKHQVAQCPSMMPIKLATTS
jgi:integrase